MKRYLVYIPICGAISIEVEADNEQEALNAAWEDYHGHGAEDFDLAWEAHKEITSGRVFYGELNEQYAEEIGEVE